MKLKFSSLIVALLLAAPTLAMAQSASEISAAKSLARSYGYSEEELDKMLNGKSGNSVTGEPTKASGTTMQSEYGSRDKLGYQKLTVSAVPGTEAGNLADSLNRLNPPGNPMKETSDIYGHKFFLSKGLSFVPSINMPAPASYTLGPGDEVTVNVWGASSANYSGTIGSDGSILIPEYGPVYIAGYTVKKAEQVLRSKLSTIYSGLGGVNVDTSIKLSVGKIKSMTINVIGEVITPGAYTLPSLCTVTSAVFMANGVKAVGSVREISLRRGGKHIGTFDLYRFFFDEGYSGDFRLQDGDIVSVASYDRVVEVSGAVKREMRYEMKEGETLEQLFKYCGGFEPDAARDLVHVERVTSNLKIAYDVKQEDFSSFILEGGDFVQVRRIEPVFANRITVGGAVMREGAYSLSESISDVKALVEAAGGLREGAYMERAAICRVDDDLNPLMTSFNLKDVMAGSVIVPLQRNDSLMVYFAQDLREVQTVSIYGNVIEPETYEFREGMTFNDLVLMAGGYKDGVDLSVVEIANRGSDARGGVHQYNLVENPSLGEVKLKAYDAVFVRRLPNFLDQVTVTVEGEVNFPGTYAIEKAQVRLSDIIERAGGFNTEAFVRGAKLTRVVTQEERDRFGIAMDVAKQVVKDDVDSTKFYEEIQYTYDIGIDLEEAMKNPESVSDVILRTGDVIKVPQMNNTVKITGGVFYPNVVVYNPKYTWRDYISLAGGVVNKGSKKKVYAVYTNGMVGVRGNKSFIMEPGMELVVPVEEKVESKKLTPGEIASLMSSTTSLAYIVVALVNYLKR